jgi:hypothetical protein
MKLSIWQTVSGGMFCLGLAALGGTGTAGELASNPVRLLPSTNACACPTWNAYAAAIESNVACGCAMARLERSLITDAVQPPPAVERGPVEPRDVLELKKLDGGSWGMIPF